MNPGELQRISGHRAEMLMDYLFSLRPVERDKEELFFRWFTEERHRWYAALVAEKCCKILKEGRYESPEKSVELKLFYLLGMLYMETGCMEKYISLCREKADCYMRQEAADGIGSELYPVIRDMALVAADKILIHDGNPTKAFAYYALYERMGGNSAGVAVKLSYCESKLPFEEVTAAYLSDRPVSADAANARYFVGREEILKRFSDTICKGNSNILTFYGQNRVGKSSILEHLKSMLREQYEVITISMDLVSGEHDFCKHFIRELCRSNGERYRELYREWRDVKHYSLMDFENFLDAVDETLRAEGASRKVLLFLDEFGIVSNESYQTWLERMLITFRHCVERNLIIVITGAEMMRKVRQDHARFFGNSKMEEIPYLTEDAVQSLLEEPLRMSNGCSRYRDKEIIAYIYKMTKGHPFITQKFAGKIVSELNQSRQNFVTWEIVNGLIHNIVADFTTSYSWFLSLLTCDEDFEEKSVRGLCGKIYRLSHDGTGSEIYLDEDKFYQSLTVEEKRIYGTLLDRKIISTGKGVRVEMPLFGAWCKQWAEYE